MKVIAMPHENKGGAMRDICMSHITHGWIANAMNIGAKLFAWGRSNNHKSLATHDPKIFKAWGYQFSYHTQV